MENPFCAQALRPGNLPFIDFATGQCSPGETVRRLEALRANRWRGEICGPHGSGKSTLVRQLAAWIQELALRSNSDCDIRLQRCVARPESKPVWQSETLQTAEIQQAAEQIEAADSSRLRSVGDSLPRRIEFYDGYEQLGLFSGLRREWLSRLLSFGLVVTCHRRGRLPAWVETRGGDYSNFLQVVRAVLAAAKLPEDSASAIAGTAEPGELDEPILSEQIERFSCGRLNSHSLHAAWLSGQGNIRESLFCLYDTWEQGGADT